MLVTGNRAKSYQEICLLKPFKAFILSVLALNVSAANWFGLAAKQLLAGGKMSSVMWIAFELEISMNKLPFKHPKLIKHMPML